MSEDKKALRARQTIIFLLIWIGVGWFGSLYISDHWQPRYMAVAWVAGMALGAFCVWLITGKKLQ